jgi:hypothetical protein
MLPGAGAAPQLIRARKILALMIVQQVIERTQGASSNRVGKPTQRETQMREKKACPKFAGIERLTSSTKFRDARV